jgi:hypothetical protein
MNSEAKMYAFEQPNVEKLKTQVSYFCECFYLFDECDVGV